ncbi:RtcB family protein [Nocardioides convexus]|uniref:RtcB family protein n=1 Tax=Nocardioides convexus TaxID=2712224 RepID=UPI0024182C6A|nr:RtcB family protein [Nocardioides convexus]
MPPTGRSRGSTPSAGSPRLTEAAEQAGFEPGRYAKRWDLQLGTLGSGNHFIEVTLDEEHRVWLFLHSGSRGVGNRIAQHHINLAREPVREVVDQGSPTRTWPTSPRAPTSSGPTSTRCGGPSGTRCSTARR